MIQCIYTASTIIVSQGKVLLHLHPLFKKWLQIGGHIEENELPHVAALRETKEETGFDVQLYMPEVLMNFTDGAEVVRPMHMVTFAFNEHKQALDFLYYASVEVPVLPDDDDIVYRWFSEADLHDKTTWPIPENIRYFALEAIRVVSAL